MLRPDGYLAKLPGPLTDAERSLLVSRNLLGLVTEVADDEIVFPPERWAATFRSNAQLILSKLGEFLGYSPQPLLERLIEDAQKIHQQRPILRETLATASNPGVSLN